MLVSSAFTARRGVARPRASRPPSRACRRSLALLLALLPAVAACDAGPPAAKPGAGAVAAGAFGYCPRGGADRCVVDGDTFRLDGARIRIADIDAPETHPPRCARERRLGDAATRRLQQLLGEGPFDLVAGRRDTDRYGRKLRIVERDGRSIGAMLVDEGLARPWEGRRRPWC